jgi:hypothetical protein
MVAKVHLGFAECLMACWQGCRRELQSAEKGSEDKHGFKNADGSGFAVHCIGAMGEMAFAKARGLWFGFGLGLFKCPDVGNVHVRTRTKNTYDLHIRPDDPQDAVFVLVTVDWPGKADFTVHGWILAKDARRPEWLQTYGNRPPAWFVPQSALKPLETLNVEVRNEC